MKSKLPTEWQELSDQLGFQEFTPIQIQLFVAPSCWRKSSRSKPNRNWQDPSLSPTKSSQTTKEKSPTTLDSSTKYRTGWTDF